MTTVLNSPVKSFSDTKDYRLIELANGLTALLIRKSVGQKPIELQTEKIAAVSLCIRVGSFWDPKNVQGLNQLMELLFFAGSSKYPKAIELNQYTRNNGGYIESSNENENIKFFFEIVNDKLEGAIDRFSNMFIAPLMTKEGIESEMEAIESAFQMIVSDDDARVNQIWASLANGPASKFGWGNLKTLKEGISSAELFTTVHAFRRKHYIANRMHLCMESTMSLEDMQKLVEDNFTSIQAGPEPEPLTIPEECFKPEFYNKIYYVKPKADESELHMSFLMPSMQKHYKSKPSEYLAHIFQHEGVGSLTSYLKKRFLALNVELELEGKNIKNNSMFSLFTIIVTLTDNGFENIEAVLEAIFSFLLMLKTTSIDNHEKAFAELKQIKDTTFRYLKENEPADNVALLSKNMTLYDTRDILSGKEVFFEFDGVIVQDLIDLLNVGKFNLLLLTDKHEKYEKTEKWFGTEYDAVDFPQKYVSLWNNRKLKSELTMPQPNEFICTNFDIISQDVDDSLLPQYPVTLFKNNFFECFYKLDGVYKLPHAIFCVHLISPLIITSVRKTVLTSLYCSIAGHYLSEKLYPAVAAGLSYKITTEDKGLLLRLSGYDEKLPLLLDNITKELKIFGGLVDSKVFTMYRDQLKKECFNEVVDMEFFNQQCRLHIIEENHKFYLDRYTEVGKISFEEFKDFANVFLNRLQVQILIQGNIAKSSASELGRNFMETLNCSEVDRAIELESRARKLPRGSSVICIKNVLANDNNSFITNYVQIGPGTVRLLCLTQIALHLMGQLSLDVLRTQEQLGFLVYCRQRYNYGIVGFSVTVQCQENKNSTTYVNERIEKFLHEKMVTFLEELTDEHFAGAKNALIKINTKKNVDLESEVDRFWFEIAFKEYMYGREELLAQILVHLTKHEVVEFYKTKMIAKDARKLSIQIVGNTGSGEVEDDENYVPKLQVLADHPVARGQKIINDMEDFKASLEMYPITKTVNEL